MDLISDSLRQVQDGAEVEFAEFLRRSHVVPHTMFFPHIGSPETIEIIKNDQIAQTPAEDEVLKYWNARSKARISEA